jgi:hypothetical protein
MATLNAAATLEQANDFASDYGTATLTIQEGATVLATHTMAGLVTANSGANATATANAIADATIAANGTADTVLLTGAGGKVIDITNDITLSTTNYISGQDSSVSSLVFTFSAS